MRFADVLDGKPRAQLGGPQGAHPWLSLTAEGRRTFERQLAALRSIAVGDGAGEIPPPSAVRLARSPEPAQGVFVNVGPRRMVNLSLPPLEPGSSRSDLPVITGPATPACLTNMKTLCSDAFFQKIANLDETFISVNKPNLNTFFAPNGALGRPPLGSLETCGLGGRRDPKYLDLLGIPAELVRNHLALLLLALVASGPSHGYGLIAELGRRSSGFLQLPEGSIYPALHRMEDAGLIRSRLVNSHRHARRTYEITARGKRELVRQRQAWWQFASAVESILRQVRIRA